MESINDYLAPLKALADPGRLRVFWLLAHIEQRICVTEAMRLLEVSHYNASRHLTLLKEANLVRAEREGKRVFYTINQEGSVYMSHLLEAMRAIPACHFQSEITLCRKLLSLR